MDNDKTGKLCLEMFLDTIPKNTKYFCDLNKTFDESHVNGDMQHEKFANKLSLSASCELCSDMEVDQQYVPVMIMEETKNSELVMDQLSDATMLVDESSNINTYKSTSVDLACKLKNVDVENKLLDANMKAKDPIDVAMLMDESSCFNINANSVDTLKDVELMNKSTVADKPDDILINSSKTGIVDQPINNNIYIQSTHTNMLVCKSIDCVSPKDLNLKHQSSFDKTPGGSKCKLFTAMYDKGLTNRKISVECLETMESLRDKCKKSGFNFNDNVTDTEFEVDMILEDEFFDGETQYFVKWKNYSSDANTWEPKCHLKGCKETIEYYHAMKRSKSGLNKNIFKYFINDLITRKPYDILTLNQVYSLCFNCSMKKIDSLQLTESQLRRKVKDILLLPDKRFSNLKEKLFAIMKYGEHRKRILVNLKEWECKINLTNQTAYIKVENNVDLETAPTGFEFIHDYVSKIITIPNEPVAFCHCESCYDNRNSCCPYDSEGHFAYSRYRRLILSPGYPIYECNKFCKCSSDCINRYVQHGQKFKVAIFRTSNGCGWGLKTLETIEKGQFVLEYLGEIITSDEAEARGKIYDYVGRSYLFDLDYGIEDCCYTIDAGHVGNAAHFINHSCNPNLHVFAVWINQPDPYLPRLAFFAKKRIKRGEELTFDYKMVQKDRFGPQSFVPEGERILCLCNSNNCRKFLF